MHGLLHSKKRGVKVNEVKPGSDLYEIWYSTPEEATGTVQLLHPVPALRRSDDFDRPFDPARDITRAPTR